jgi:hypothetical protein
MSHGLIAALRRRLPMRLRSFVCALALVVTPSVAHGTPLLYTDRAAFESAIGPTTVYDFGPVTPVFNPNTSTSDLVYDGMKAMIDSAEGGEAINAVNTGTLRANNYAFVLRFTTPRSAFGFDVVQTTGAPFMLGIPEYIIVAGLSGFVGITLDTPVSGLVVFPWTYPGDGSVARSPVTIDNVTVKRVPEPATRLLMALGTTMLYRRRRA